jgi:hypothetical protein
LLRIIRLKAKMLRPDGRGLNFASWIQEKLDAER